jgi:signal transduction histidine kinase
MTNATRQHKERHLLAGFIVTLAVVLAVAVFTTMAYEHRRTRQDLLDLATAEARMVLDAVVVAIQTTSGIRQHLQDAGVDRELVQKVVREYGTGMLLHRLGTRGAFDYLVCQDRSGIVAAYGVTELSAIEADPFLASAFEGNEVMTRLLAGEPPRLEVVQPFVTDTHRYLLRVCIDLLSIELLEQRAMRRQMLLGAVFLFVSFLLTIYLLNIHNTRLLARERDSITAEVEVIQQRLRQQERVAAMGRLAAGIAHEVRNPLNAIQMLIQRLQREIEPSASTAGKLTKFTDVIRGELKRINRIIEEFLQFARARPPVFQRVDPGMIARGICMLERGLMDMKEVSLVERIGGPFEEITADPQQLTQALLNVVRNAAEATPARGTVSVSVQQRNGTTVFAVSDTGSGMSADTREKAFDLYFSTKDHGTGLGLAITRRIIEQHDGDILISTREPHGTRVEIHIPNTRTDEDRRD